MIDMVTPAVNKVNESSTKVLSAVVRVDSVAQQLKERSQEMKWLLMTVLLLRVSTPLYRKTEEHKFAKRIDEKIQPLDFFSLKLEANTKKLKDL